MRERFSSSDLDGTAAVVAARDDVFASYYQDVSLYAASRAKRGDEVKDIVQEAYLRVFRLAHPERVQAPRRFLFRTVRNLILDRARKRQVRERYAAADDALIETVPDLAPTPDVAAGNHERQAMLANAVSALPERTREIFILHAHERMSYSEIAEHMDLSKTAVAKHLARAISTVTTTLRETSPAGAG